MDSMDSMDSWLCRPHQLLTAPEADLDTQRLLGRIFIDSTPAANIKRPPKRHRSGSPFISGIIDAAYVPAIIGTISSPLKLIGVRRDRDGRLVSVDADGRRYTVEPNCDAFLRTDRYERRRITLARDSAALPFKVS